MAFEIRPATPTHIDGIRRVAEKAWYSAHEPIIGSKTVDEFLKKHYDAEAFRSLIENDDAIFAVAVTSESDVVGFASATLDNDCSTTYHLGRIYVLPERWGEGIGRRLLATTEQNIERRGGEQIELGVMAENERAVKFYESNGYRRENEFYDNRIDTHSYEYRKEMERGKRGNPSP
ncbi:Ribosomal protein S18 acetylase RimI [Haladaptatus litoreus]|uniref:Ribosomal protein S18 acetylase RimI n=1 Tax=Haladaptatus litoreus TaxID=553468 RepID=A0A1N7BMC4_9EURY|nr:GNAT family N-acetyltransferase [Haladaptatus litoreus]SIR52383.1 Ribosomal protein S18 acetylase RimI [Haladaptatus litoreus]